jgi:hypothetical protein
LPLLVIPFPGRLDGIHVNNNSTITIWEAKESKQ